MRKTTIMLTFYLLMFCDSVYSQSLASTLWQLQNPSIASNNEALAFEKNNEFSYSIWNMVTMIKSTEKGIYQLLGDKLILTFKDRIVEFTIIWKKPTLIYLYYNANTDIYASIFSTDDQFMKNYLRIKDDPIVNSTNERDVTCYTCFGTGSCKVCGGTGIYSAYGYSSDCTACAMKRGKCWHCLGSGKQ